MQQQFHTSCLLCGKEQLTDLQEYKKDYLVKCVQCNFVFSKKIFSKEQIKQEYDNYERSDYLSDITIKRYHQLLDIFETYRKTNKLIDIGCGVGHFLEIAKQRGWTVYGTEFTETAIEICQSKGITIFKTEIIDSIIISEDFDIITSFEVIEHFENPLTEIKKIIPYLRKGGVFYTTTPNFNSLSRYLLKSKWVAGIGTPEHLSYFTPKTIKFLFRKNNFSVLKITTSGISLSALKGELPNSHQLSNHFVSIDEKIRTRINSNVLLNLLKILINFLLDLTSKGDTIKIFAIKR